MEITVNKEENCAIIQIEGKVTRDNQADFRSKLEEVIQNGTKGIALDFEKLKYMDSSGMGCCVSILRLMYDKTKLDEMAEKNYMLGWRHLSYELLDEKLQSILIEIYGS